MSNKYIYIYEGNSKDRISIFDDFKKLPNVQYIATKRKTINNRFLKFISKIHLSYTISQKINLPFKSIWYDLSEIKINEKDSYTIIMMPTVFLNMIFLQSRK